MVGRLADIPEWPKDRPPTIEELVQLRDAMQAAFEKAHRELERVETLIRERDARARAEAGKSGGAD